MNPRFLIFIVLSFAFNLVFGQALPPSSAKIQGFIISSENLSRDLENDTVALSGQVKIIYQNQFIEAEKVDIDFKKKQAYLEGHVKVQTPQYLIGGERVVLDYESNQGIIYVGFVQSNNIRFQGDVIEKINETDFYVSNADYTSCTNCPATWSFEGQKIRAELGGYAYIKNTFLKVSGIPVFWLPYLVVPLKSERQTGLLFPEIGYITKRNLVFTQDFFWAKSRSDDATFSFKNYELGGPKLLIEYRYALDEYSAGYVKTGFMRDSVFASEDRFLNYVPLEKKSNRFNRYYLYNYHQYKLTENNRFQLKSTIVSDLQYPKDFTDEVTNYADSSLETRLTYGYTLDEGLFQIDGSMYRSLLQANPVAGDEFSVQRLPEIRFESTYKPFFQTPLLYRIDSSWTNFQRTKYFDDLSVVNGQKFASNTANNPTCENDGDANCQIQQDGIFDPTVDNIRTGQRFLFKSSLTTKAHKVSDILLLTPTLSYSEAQYYFADLEDKTSARRFLQFELNTRSKFYKVYDNNPEEPNVRYKNEIIPEIQYSWIPWVYSEQHPFFGNQLGNDPPYTSRSTISDKDVNTAGGVLFDYEDKVYDRHIVSFSLLDRYIRKKLVDNSYKTLVSFRLTQSYDLYQSQYGLKKDQPLSNLSATLNIDLDQVQSYSQIDYYPYNSATDTATSISYLNDQQQYFRIGYTSKRIDEPKQDDVSFALGFVTNYVNVLTGVIFDASADRESSSRLKKVSLITQLKPPGECWAVNFYRDQKVGAGAEWKFTFDFSFDGKPTKVIPPAELKMN